MKSFFRNHPTAGYILLIGLVLLAFWVIRRTTDVKAEARAGVILELPERIGAWTGVAAPVQPIEREYLGADTEFARKVYRRPDGRELFLGIVLSGRDRSSIHAAEACLVGQGWTLSGGEVIGIPMDKPKAYTLDVMRLNITRELRGAGGRKTPIRNWYCYWFVGQNRLTARHMNRILWTAFDRIFSNVHHRWAYVAVNVNVPPGQEAEAERMVREFLREAVPAFQKAPALHEPPRDLNPP